MIPPIVAVVTQTGPATDAIWVPGRWTPLDPALESAILRSVVLIVILVLLRAAALWILHSRTDDIRISYRWRKTITYTTVLVGMLLVGRVWYEGVAHLATFLGLVTAGLAIALRDPIVNLFGWLFIAWRRPFVVGDRIQIGGFAGDVVDLRPFQILVLEIGNWVDADQSTGRLIHIPNGLVFREPTANYTRGMQLVWDELRVPITFESNWRRAKEILTEIVNRHARDSVEQAEQEMARASRQFMIFYTTLTPTVYTAVRENGPLLTLRYLCPPRRRRGMQQAMWEDILTAFQDADDIRFAYPTIRYYDNTREDPGPGARPSTD
jgi:small-conductance mechanosensitive channel